MQIIGIYNSIIRLTHTSHTHTFNPRNFISHYKLIEKWKLIQNDADKIYSKKSSLLNMKNLFSGFNHIDAEENQWKVFVVKWYDKPNPHAKKICPNTLSIINSCPDIHAAMFSILEPGKYIPPHRGPFTGCLRYHLGLRIPKDNKNCYIKVNDEKFHWNEGSGLIFDDTYEHSVYNNTNEPRIILFIDIERPLNFPLNIINSFLCDNGSIASFNKQINDNSEKVKELYINHI
jgi:beta-hydroxylase